MSQPDEELRRRLADLAESADPWADPLPAVMRRTHAEPRLRRPLFPAGRRRWSLAAAAVITLIVGIALGVYMCHSSAAQNGPASNKADHAVVSPSEHVRVGGFIGPRCAIVERMTEGGAPALGWLSVKYLRAHESRYAHGRTYPRILRVYCRHQGNCPRADQE
jgi:hypothetical protein